jgi:hypothetical protein
MSQTSSFSQRGKVSYGLRVEGFFIAHSSLPLNSRAKIVNMSTGKEVEVTVNRHIPASPDVIADISPSVWQELGLTPETEVRIYTPAPAKAQTTASTAPTVAPTPAAAPAPAPAAKPQEAAPRTVQATQPADGFPYGGNGNVSGGVKFENNFIVNGIPIAMTEQAVKAAAAAASAYVPRPQTTPPVAVYVPRPQTVQPAAAPDTRTQTVQLMVPSIGTRQTPPGEVSDIWAQIAKSSLAGLPRAQAPQPAPAPRIETRPQTAAPVAVNDPRQQTAQPAAITPIVVINETRPQAGQPVYQPWIQPAVPPTIIETRPQTVTPSAVRETWTQPAPVTPAFPPAAKPATGTNTQPARPGVVIETTPQTGKSAVIINSPQQTANSAVIIQTPPEAFPPLPAMPAFENWPSQNVTVETIRY